MKLVIILIGASGSGKTTLAKELCDNYYKLGYSSWICSADKFFTKPDGTYNFDVSKLNEAHKQCQLDFLDAMKRKTNIIIIDNTNTRLSERQFYEQYAIGNDYEVQHKEPNTSWKYDSSILVEKNIHKVSKEIIEHQLRRIQELKKGGCLE